MSDKRPYGRHPLSEAEELEVGKAILAAERRIAQLEEVVVAARAVTNLWRFQQETGGTAGVPLGLAGLLHLLTDAVRGLEAAGGAPGPAGGHPDSEGA